MFKLNQKKGYQLRANESYIRNLKKSKKQIAS